MAMDDTLTRFWNDLLPPDRPDDVPADSPAGDGATHELRVLVLGVVMDVIYQFMVFRWVYPVELVIVVLALAFLPYLLLRGPINRLTRRWVGGGRSYTP
jgi:hypothetical protein